jgi:hypothetical protein
LRYLLRVRGHCSWPLGKLCVWHLAAWLYRNLTVSGNREHLRHGRLTCLLPLIECWRGRGYGRWLVMGGWRNWHRRVPVEGVLCRRWGGHRNWHCFRLFLVRGSSGLKSSSIVLGRWGGLQRCNGCALLRGGRLAPR